MDNNIFEENAAVKAVLISVITDADSEKEAAVSLEELERLLETAGGELAAQMVQLRHAPNPKTYIGSGKIKELSELCVNTGANLVVADAELSPAQINNIEEALEADVRVIDRTMLILDIFALHAMTAEGRLQVELAQLRYTIPRLIGHGKDLSRLGGGIGTRGPGESKLESDRRHLARRINTLAEQIKELEATRVTQRAKRERSGIFRIAVAGYTNAGKSTLLNRLTDAGVLAENKLFATLDPTTKKYTLPSGHEILLTDTVGFIRNLPHHLINAFRSTLEEVVYADAILIVIDASDENAESQLEVTEKLIYDLGAGGKPVIYALNKCDRLESITDEFVRSAYKRNTVCISALDGRGIDMLVGMIENTVKAQKKDILLRIPMSKQKLVSMLYEKSIVKSVDYCDGFVEVRAMLDEKTRGQLAEYIVSE